MIPSTKQHVFPGQKAEGASEDQNQSPERIVAAFGEKMRVLKEKRYMEQWKKGPTGCLGYFWGWNPTQLCGEYFINRYKHSIKRPVLRKVSECFFAQVSWPLKSLATLRTYRPCVIQAHPLFQWWLGMAELCLKRKNPSKAPILLLMGEILHQLIGSLSHYLPGCYTSKVVAWASTVGR